MFSPDHSTVDYETPSTSTGDTKRAYGDPVFPSLLLRAILCIVDRGEGCAPPLLIRHLGIQVTSLPQGRGTDRKETDRS